MLHSVTDARKPGDTKHGRNRYKKKTRGIESLRSNNLQKKKSTNIRSKLTRLQALLYNKKRGFPKKARRPLFVTSTTETPDERYPAKPLHHRKFSTGNSGLPAEPRSRGVRIIGSDRSLNPNKVRPEKPGLHLGVTPSRCAGCCLFTDGFGARGRAVGSFSSEREWDEQHLLGWVKILRVLVQLGVDKVALGAMHLSGLWSWGSGQMQGLQT